MKNLDLRKMYQRPIYLGTARNARKGVQKPAPVAFLSYWGEVQEDGAQAGSSNVAINRSRSAIRQTSIFPVEWWEFPSRDKHFSLL